MSSTLVYSKIVDIIDQIYWLSLFYLEPVLLFKGIITYILLPVVILAFEDNESELEVRLSLLNAFLTGLFSSDEFCACCGFSGNLDGLAGGGCVTTAAAGPLLPNS